MRLHNKTILDKPFIFDINPAYSTNAKTFSGSGLLSSIKIIEIAPSTTRYSLLAPISIMLQMPPI
jgi:hypothetical protein